MREPNALITTDAVARDLSGGDLRVFDCTTYLEPPPSGSDDPYIAVPGRSSFEEERTSPALTTFVGERLVRGPSRILPASAAYMHPKSFSSGASPRFHVPITLGVIPDECQSMLITVPNDWNQNGWAAATTHRGRNDGQSVG